MANLPRGVPTIELPDEELLGPSMRACTPAMQRFVIALLTRGDDNYTEAALQAGISPITAQSYGSRLAHHPKIAAAIREEADKRMRGAGILAASQMMKIAMDLHHKDCYKACDRLLSQSGLMVETVQRHIIEDHRSDKELEQAIILLAKRNGLAPEKLLGRPPVEDAEFEEVEGSMGGLEDLLG